MADACTKDTRGAGRLLSAIAPSTASAAVAVLLFLSPAVAAAWSGTCEVRFRGTSTLHDFTGHVACQPFRLGVDPAAGGGTVIPGAEVAAVADDMDTGNRTRDRQMRETLQSGAFPRIRATFGPIDPQSFRREIRRSRDATVPLDFTLTIRDVSRPVHGVAGGFREAGADVTFDVRYAVSLSDFRLPPPRALFGLVRVGDTIDVTTTVHLDTSVPR